MQTQQMTDEEFLQRGLEIYAQKLKPILEPGQIGRKVAISVEDEDYEVGDTSAEAMLRLEQRHPGALFVFVDVGEPIARWPLF